VRVPNGNYEWHDMKKLLAAVALMLPAGGLVYANDPPAPTTNTQAQAQARQFGIFFGGTASQYDLCVKKGFLRQGEQNAEAIAKSFLEKTWATSPDTDQSIYVLDGWNNIKKEISENESFYTQPRCAAVGKQWAKLLEVIRKKQQGG
jgi:hypothetical protein